MGLDRVQNLQTRMYKNCPTTIRFFKILPLLTINLKQSIPPLVLDVLSSYPILVAMCVKVRADCAVFESIQEVHYPNLNPTLTNFCKYCPQFYPLQ